MAKIAETYIHLKIDANEEFLVAARSYLYHRGNTFANDIFQWEVAVSVKVEDGSLRVWVTVLGAIYLSISQYGSFRSGIDYTIKDSRTFSDLVIKDFLKESGIQNEEVVRLEKRLGVPGKIQRLFKLIERLEENEFVITRGAGSENDEVVFAYDNKDKQEIIKKIKMEIISILRRLDQKKDRELFVNSLPNSIKKASDGLSENELDSLLNNEYFIKEEEVEIEVPPMIKRLPLPE